MSPMKTDEMMFVANLPKQITPEIIEFCKGLDPDATPVYVDVEPVRVNVERRCYMVVEAMTNIGGGEPQNGWMIWELPRMYMCDEHHCVIRYPDRLLDPNEQIGGERKILFLPTNIQYPSVQDRLILPRYRIANDHPLLKRYLDLVQQLRMMQAVTGDFEGMQSRLLEAQATKALQDYERVLAHRKEKDKLKKYRDQRKAKRH
jgi:hypothetical protein